MQVVILCGGKGTRMREETEVKPKPLVEIGGMPILWHIMKIYSFYGFNKFILCLGYKGNMIKEFFMNFEWMANDFTLEMGCGNGKITTHNIHPPEDWEVTFVDTGLETQTGGRLKKIEHHIKGDDFFLTYGDAVSDINIEALLNLHREKGRVATLTGIHPSSRFGILEVKDGIAASFKEKPVMEGLINGGFFVFNRKIFSYIDDDSVLEHAPLKKLSSEGQLAVFEHTRFWQCMDTFKDVEYFAKIWNDGIRPWVIWK